MVDIKHQDYYGGDSIYEAIKVIQAWDLDFALGNVVKYVKRAGLKSSATKLEDLKKARTYIDFAIGDEEYKESKRMNEVEQV